jgi:hypothetical protein
MADATEGQYTLSACNCEGGAEAGDLKAVLDAALFAEWLASTGGVTRGGVRALLVTWRASAMLSELALSHWRLLVDGVKGDVNLMECFERFTEKEQLGATNLWICPKVRLPWGAYVSSLESILSSTSHCAY